MPTQPIIRSEPRHPNIRHHSRLRFRKVGHTDNRVRRVSSFSSESNIEMLPKLGRVSSRLFCGGYCPLSSDPDAREDDGRPAFRSLTGTVRHDFSPAFGPAQASATARQALPALSISTCPDEQIGTLPVPTNHAQQQKDAAAESVRNSGIDVMHWVCVKGTPNPGTTAAITGSERCIARASR
jgi:hypothetical protein